jgi:hypothetical protein
MIVPYFGALASSIPPILYALTISPQKAILVGIIYLLAHQVEGNLIQPLVVARTVKLHPAVVAIGVVAVDQLFGFIGLLVAVPVIATATILVDELWVKPLRAGPGPGRADPPHERRGPDRPRPTLRRRIPAWCSAESRRLLLALVLQPVRQFLRVGLARARELPAHGTRNPVAVSHDDAHKLGAVEPLGGELVSRGGQEWAERLAGAGAHRSNRQV